MTALPFGSVLGMAGSAWAFAMIACAVISAGPPTEVITSAMLRDVYRVDGRVHLDQDQQLTITARHGL